MSDRAGLDWVGLGGYEHPTGRVRSGRVVLNTSWVVRVWSEDVQRVTGCFGSDQDVFKQPRVEAGQTFAVC